MKSLKQQSTLVCIFSCIEKKKIKNKIKVHKVHKIYHYNSIGVEGSLHTTGFWKYTELFNILKIFF